MVAHKFSHFLQFLFHTSLMMIVRNLNVASIECLLLSSQNKFVSLIQNKKTKRNGIHLFYQISIQLFIALSFPNIFILYFHKLRCNLVEPSWWSRGYCHQNNGLYQHDGTRHLWLDAIWKLQCHQSCHVTCGRSSDISVDSPALQNLDPHN